MIKRYKGGKSYTNRNGKMEKKQKIIVVNNQIVLKK